MRSAGHRSRRRNGSAAVVAGLALVVAVAAQWAARHGLATSADSWTYLSAAQNLRQGLGLSDLTGHPLTVFPPGLPALYAGAEWLGLSGTAAARVVNAVSQGATVGLTAALLRRHVRSDIVWGALTLLAAVSTPMLRVVDWVASDAPFVAVTLAFLLAVDGLPTDRIGRYRRLAGAVLLVWMGFMLRYTGLVLLVAGSVVVVVGVPGLSRRRALAEAAGFTAAEGLVPALWLLHNAGVPPYQPFGLRVSSTEGFAGVAHDLIAAAVHLLVPDRISPRAGAIALGLVALVTGMLAWPVWRHLASAATRGVRSLLPVLVFCLGYAGFVTVSHKLAGSDLTPRILLPAYFPALVLLGWYADQMLAGSQRQSARSRLTGTVVVVGLVAVVGATSIWFVRQVDAGAVPTIYRVTSQARSELAAAVAADRGALLVSNDPWRLYAETAHQPDELAPLPMLPGFSQAPMTPAALHADACTGAVSLFWFHPASPGPIGSVDAIAGTSRVDVVAIAAVPNGTEYRLRPVPGTCQTHPGGLTTPGSGR